MRRRRLRVWVEDFVDFGKDDLILDSFFTQVANEGEIGGFEAVFDVDEEECFA